MYNPGAHYTLEEYEEIVNSDPYHKYEYVEGYVRMMAGGTTFHGQIMVNVGRVLGNCLYDSECNVYSSDVSVKLAEKRYYYPDVSVSCDPYDWTRKRALEAPTLVVEILSPSTEHIDTREKLKAYKSYPTIQEILLIDSRRCYVEHHHRLVDEEWQLNIYKRDEDIIEISSLEIAFPLRDIYHKVYLEEEEGPVNEE